MPITKESLSDFKEKYEKAEKLVEEDSKHDPETQPYRSHYGARDILIEIENNLKNILQELNCNIWLAVASADNEKQTADDENSTVEHVEEDTEDILTYKFILGFIYKDIGRISVWTEELSTGEKYLKKSLNLLSPYKLRPECVNAYLGALNQIGILWANRENPKKSKESLDEAEKLYNEFKLNEQAPLTLYDLFGTRDEIEINKGMDVLEKTHTLTLYYLAQVIGTLGDLHKSAVYCHTTLKRQLEFNDYEKIDWALNAATLSQYFFANNRNMESRHHLAAANYMMDQYEIEMNSLLNLSEDQQAALKETFHHRSADVMRCWAKYGLNLLLESKNRLVEENGDKYSPKKTPNEKPCKFESLNLSEYEHIITDQYLLMFDDAKPVFLAVQNWLNRAKDYYTPETEATEYSKIVQDLAESYKYMAFYEFDESNQCKLHKRRADLLEDVLVLLNETYYMSVCREIWYELGLAYSTMLDIKLELFDRMKINQHPGPQILNKINMLCNKSINKFLSYVNSYNDVKTKELRTDNIDNDELEPIMFAYFQIGRLYYKIMTPDRQMQITNTENSLKYYQMFVKKCDENKVIGDKLKAEHGVCKEMISLLPLKIKKLTDGTFVNV